MAETYTIQEQIGKLTADGNGKWTKELNLISWFGKPAKYDIRDWDCEHEKMGKGVTLSEDELFELYKLLKGFFGEECEYEHKGKTISTQDFFLK